MIQEVGVQPQLGVYISYVCITGAFAWGRSDQGVNTPSRGVDKTLVVCTKSDNIWKQSNSKEESHVPSVNCMHNC